jgi:hypothetical protein
MSDFPRIPEGLDEGHVHEVVDRLHVVICTIEDHIAGHPLVGAIPSIKEKIDRAMAILADAYQEAGAVGFVPPWEERDPDKGPQRGGKP